MPLGSVRDEILNPNRKLPRLIHFHMVLEKRLDVELKKVLAPFFGGRDGVLESERLLTLVRKN